MFKNLLSKIGIDSESAFGNTIQEREEQEGIQFESFKKKKIDARTNTVAIELKKLEQMLSETKRRATETSPDREVEDKQGDIERIFTRVARKRIQLEELHKSGYRELLPEESNEDLEQQLSALLVTINNENTKKEKGEGNGMFEKEGEEVITDILRRSRENVALIQQIMQESAQKQEKIQQPQGEGVTLFAKAQQIQGKLAQFIDRLPANDQSVKERGVDPDFNVLILLNNDITRITSRLTSTLARVQELVKLNKELHFSVSLSKDTATLQSQENMAKIIAFDTEITTLKQKLSNLVSRLETELDKQIANYEIKNMPASEVGYSFEPKQRGT